MSTWLGNRTTVAGVVAAGLLVTACGGDSTPVTPNAPTVYTFGQFQVLDETSADRGLIDSIGTALPADWDQVTAFLPEFKAPEGTITFYLRSGTAYPSVDPQAQVITAWDGDLSLEYLPHLLTHVLTGYARRAFIEEGIAVYVSEQLDPDNRTINPYRGQPTGSWMSLFEQYKSTIPLATAFDASNLGFDYGGSSPDASAWQLFIEAGSFTDWVFENYGRQGWLRLYDIDALGMAFGELPVDLEIAWLAVMRDRYPTPLTCEEALATRGPLGSREEFWCARARGE